MTVKKVFGNDRKSNRRKGRPVGLNPRDIDILNYIWKWKLASTASIHEAINKIHSPYGTYKILEKLERSDYICSQFDIIDRFNVWQLTSKGFLALLPRMKPLVEEGYLSENHYHDRLVQAFHLGEWCSYNFPQVEIWSEQDMRRHDSADYPDWVPGSRDHRPDGYTRLKFFEKNVVLSFEVELSCKRPALYEKTLDYYKHARNVYRVYWLVKNQETKDVILRARSCINEDSTNYHLFVDLDDYLKNGWDAVVTNERSERVKTFRENMQGLSGDIPGDLLGTNKGHSTVLVHLNPIKTLAKPRR